MRWSGAMATLLIFVMLAATACAADPVRGAGHFKLTYAGIVPDRDDRSLLETLEGAYGHVNGYFGTLPESVEVIVIEDGDMDRAGKEVDSFSAWNKLYSAVVLRRGLLKNKSALPVIAQHEMAHLAINDILCKKDPRDFQWMEEGVCMLVSGEDPGDRDVSRYIVGHGFLERSDIYGAIKDEDAGISKNGYMQSYGLVRHIVKRFGLDALVRMMKSPESGFEKAFSECTGEDFGAFYREWQNDVKSTASRR